MLKRILSLVLSLLMVCSVLAVNVTTALAEDNQITQTFLDRVKEDYDLVWSDEFNGDTLDTTKWGFDGQMCRRNSELQMYADSMEDGNLQFDGESAIIVPKVEARVAADGRKYKYTSAEISTQGKQSWKYGYFEIRAKQACGKNIVPAIWMMGYDYNTGSCDWPYSGEIDIMERLNSDKATESTLHHGSAYGSKAHKATGAGGQSYDHKINEQFHNYWLYWTDKYLVIGVDDAMHSIMDITKPELAQSFRTYEHWLIINVALGMFANPVDESQEDEWKMWIDYVRVYQLNDDKLYDNYKTFSALDLMNNGNEYAYGKTVSTLKTESQLDFTITDELEPGKYDVYAEIGNKNILTYINGVQTNEIKAIDHGKAVGNQAFVGSVDLQDESDFDITFKGKDGSGVTVEKLIFVKTDDNKTAPVVVNKDNCVTVSDYFEVSTEDELVSAAKHLLPNGTIKLKNDITLTKNIQLFNNDIIDLNGKTITVNKGRFLLNSEAVRPTIKNGNVIISGDSTNFIYTKENNYGAKVKCEDLNITINSTASSYVFNHNYGAINIEANNCEFTFGERVSSSSSYMIARNAGIYNNCTFNLKGRKAFLMSNGSNTSTKKLYFNNCVVNDALYLFHSDNALTNYVDVKLSNTCINNLGSLSNFTENAGFFSVESNSVLKDANGEEVTDYANMTGSYTMECNHNYLDADCLLPKHCQYCNKSEGKALGHNLVTTTTPADCLHKGSIKTECSTCSAVLSEKVLPVIEHNYEFVSTTEPSCTHAGYHLWACSDCGMKQQRSYNGDGVVVKPAHTYDESQTTVIAPTCTMGGYSLKYCTSCQTQRKTLYKKSSDHECTQTVNYENNTILYDCKNCDYTNTVPLDTCPHTPVEGSGVVTEPTCKDKGYTEYTCELCNKTYKDDFVDALSSCVAASGKDVVVPETCGTEGYTEHTCKFCGEKFKTDFVSATGKHTPDNTKDKVVAPTCKEVGYTERYCTVCKNTYKTDETEIDPDAHNPQVSGAVESTCESTGLTEGSYCGWCNETLVAQKETPKKPHTEAVIEGYEATCNKAGFTDEIYCSVCNEVLTPKERIPMLEHVEVIDFSREASCSQTGLTEGSHCKLCGEILVSQVESPKTPHLEIVDRGYSATCDKTGLTNGKHCSVCGEVTLKQEEIAKLPHTKSSWEIVKQATETEEGERVRKCVVCGEIVQTETLPKTACVHTTVIKNFKAATYFATGFSGDTVCIKCGVTTSKGVVTAQLKLAKPKFTAKKKGKQIKVSYKKAAGVNKIQIRYRVKGKWKIKLVNAKKNTVTKTLKNLKKGKYKVQIRTMVVSGKQKVYSKWSKAQKVKI